VPTVYLPATVRVELDDRLVHRLLQFVAPHYSARDPAHDLTHIERLLGQLGPLSVGVEPPPRPHLLAFLGCFHGLGRKMLDDSTLREQATELLKALGWTDDDIRLGFEMLPRHLSDPRTSEEQVVHDANYVELLGALGIAKAFTTGGSRGQRYHETVKIFETGVLDRVTFRTPAGRTLAEEGRAYVKAFLRRLEVELKGPTNTD